MWSVFKYVVDSPDAEHQEPAQTDDETVKDVRPDDIVETIKREVDKNAENYIVALHYLDFPVLIHFGLGKMKETPHIKTLRDYLEPAKEVRKILLMNVLPTQMNVLKRSTPRLYTSSRYSKKA